MKRVIVLTAAALALAGCAHRATNRPPAAKLVAPALSAPSAALTAPAPAKGLDWFADLQGAQGKLAYGAPHSDDVRLMLTCAKGSGKVTVDQPAAPPAAGAPALLSIASGSARARWLAEAKPLETAPGQVMLTVTVNSTEPVMDAFQRNGWIIGLTADGKPDGAGMAPHGGDGAVKRFFEFCG